MAAARKMAVARSAPVRCWRRSRTWLRRARLTLGGDPAHHAASASPGSRGGQFREFPVATLTEREREVLDLLAEGRSNREIATALFIAPKTASVHVSNILGKLGASSRTEAAAIARREGLVSQPSAR